MPVFSHEDLRKVLNQIERENISPIYLLHGDRYLVKSALDKLLDLLIPETERDTNLEVSDGKKADFEIEKALDSLNTFALFGGSKVVLIEDCQIFYSRVNIPDLLAKSEEAHQEGQLEEAARFLLRMLSFCEWSLDDVTGGGWREIPSQIWEETIGESRDEDQMAWFDEIVAHASDNEMKVPERRDDATLLEKALEQGFAPGQYLLLTTDAVDKRRSLYHLMEKKGVIVDFSVASGTSRQAKSKQRRVLNDLVKGTLSTSGKTIDRDALDLLVENTGFNVWALKTQLDKLVSFVGDDTIITREDVEDLSEDIREEPIYELSNAVSSRDCSASLVVLNRLLDQGMHPLQLLSTLANEFRKLLVAREFIDHNLGGQLDPTIPYPKFNKSIYPLLKPLTGKETVLGTPHPYALYKTLARSATYQLADLINCMHYLFDVDMTLKSTQITERAVMESLVIRLCQV